MAAALVAGGCQKSTTTGTSAGGSDAKIPVTTFGKLPSGGEAKLFTLTNKNGMRAKVSDLGATLVSLEVPDKAGKLADVTHGFESPEGYLSKENPYFGQGLGTSAEIPVVGHGRDFVVGHSHSSILETFRVGGITGGLAFLVMIFCNLRTTVQASDERRFFLFWLLFGTLCLSTNGRLPIIRPSVEWFAFWIPMFLASLTHATTTTNATLGRSHANRR